MLDHSCQVQRHTNAERGVDLYETPDVAVEALLRVEPNIPKLVWEPACGRGRIVRVLGRHLHKVIASDIVDYGQPLVLDFLGPDGSEVDDIKTDCILTNPPFRFAQQFVETALQRAPLVIMLLRLAFLESQRRTHILENAGLCRVHVFRKRLPMMHRDGWEGRKANSGMAFAWFVWQRGYIGAPSLHRISWESPPSPDVVVNPADEIYTDKDNS